MCAGGGGEVCVCWKEREREIGKIVFPVYDFYKFIFPSFNSNKKVGQNLFLTMGHA